MRRTRGARMASLIGTCCEGLAGCSTNRRGLKGYSPSLLIPFGRRQNRGKPRPMILVDQVD
jgi:hypothetical protein